MLLIIFFISVVISWGNKFSNLSVEYTYAYKKKVIDSVRMLLTENFPEEVNTIYTVALSLLLYLKKV